MPEILEIESYRERARSLIGRRVESVESPDPWFLKRGLDAATLGRLLPGRRIEDVGRKGKLLILDFGGFTLGLRFGMTGRLVVDGAMAIDRLEYGSDRRLAAWRRFALHLDARHELAIDDPRRLGGIELDPALDRLGVDALSLDLRSLRAALEGATGPLKARLMDQTRIAGLGNLLTDEALWRCGLDPARDSASLDRRELAALSRAIATTVRVLGRRGGSHTGDHQPARVLGAPCPRPGCDGTMSRRTIGGRTTYSCPLHQR